MLHVISDHGVTLDLPEGFEASTDGSVFGPSEEFALYKESVEETPRADLPFRREIIAGRSYVETFLREETTTDGWITTFRTEDGTFGFELGRQLGGARIVFWGDRLVDEASLARVLELCATKASPAAS